MEIGDLSKAKIEWTFDLIESQNKIYYFDDDGDGLLNENEIDNFYNEGFKSVRDFNYFITLKIGDKSYPVQEIEDFKAHVIDDGRLSVSFFIELPQFQDSEALSITHFDTSYFISFSEPDTNNIILPNNLYSAVIKNLSKPFYYDPQAGRDKTIDTSSPKSGWLTAYPTEVYISGKPIITQVGEYKLSFRERLNQVQKIVYKKLSENLNGLQTSTGDKTIILILLLSLLYGIIHAIGPGHRKIVISSYILSQNKISYIKTIIISLSSALIHSGSGIFSVLILVSIFQKVAPDSITKVSYSLEKFSYYSLLFLALLMLIFKIIRLIKKRNTKEIKNVELPFILLSSIVPCPGSITIMLFSVSMNIIYIGIFSVLSMSLGIGITLSVISILVIKGKGMFSSKILLTVFESIGLFILLLIPTLYFIAN